MLAAVQVREHRQRLERLAQVLGEYIDKDEDLQTLEIVNAYCDVLRELRQLGSRR